MLGYVHKPAVRFTCFYGDGADRKLVPGGRCECSVHDTVHVQSREEDQLREPVQRRLR